MSVISPGHFFSGQTMRNFKHEDSHRTVNGVKQKRCAICAEWKPESDYDKDRARKDGLKSWCKDCNGAYEGELKRKRRKGTIRKFLRYEERHRVVKGAKQKLCRKCEKWKGEKEFYRDRSGKDGLTNLCKKCSCKVAGERYGRRLAVDN